MTDLHALGVDELARWVRLSLHGDPDVETGLAALAVLVERLQAAEAANGAFTGSVVEADKAASKAHDAIYAEPFDKQAASDAIWEIHNWLRPMIPVTGEDVAGNLEGDLGSIARKVQDDQALLSNWRASGQK